MNYGIVIGWLLNFYKAYQDSATHAFFVNLEKHLQLWFEASWFRQFFTGHEGMVEDFNGSYAKKLTRKINGSGLSEWLKASWILKLVLNKTVLKLFVYVQIFSYVLLPTLIGVVISIGIVGLLILYRLTDTNQPQMPLVSVAMGIVVATMAVSLLFNPVSSDGLVIWLIYMSTFAFSAMILGTFRDRQFVREVMVIIGIMVILLGVYGVYQKSVGVPVDPAWLDEDVQELGVRVYSVFGNPNVYGEFLVLVLPLMFAGINRHENKWMKLFFAGAFLLGGLNVVLTLSRGSMMSLGIALILIVLFKDRKYLPLIVLGILLSPYFVPEAIIGRIMSIFEGGDTSMSYRVSIYRASFDMLEDYFIQGTGLGNFKVLYKAYAYSAAKSFHAHNTLLMLMIELGLVGILAYIFYFFTWARAIFSVQKKKSVYAYYAFAAFAGVVGCTVQGMVDHIFHNYDILFVYILMMTIGVISAYAAREEHTDV